MYSAERYREALDRLGPHITEGQRRMLAAHASAPGLMLDVVKLAEAAGQKHPNYTYGQYGALGRALAAELNHPNNEWVWTRLLGEDSRDPVSGFVRWRLYENMAAAVRDLGWTPAAISEDVGRDLDAAEPSLAGLDATTRTAVIEARLKQGLFRQQLVAYWGSCAVTGCGVLEALTASHIKPWRESTNHERLDPFNGLLLLGTLDRLFDGGRITFDDSGLLLVSDIVPRAEWRALGLRPGQRLSRVEAEHGRYLAWHRERVFAGAR